MNVSTQPAPDVTATKPAKHRKSRRLFYGGLAIAYLLVATFGGCADRMLLYPTTDPLDIAPASRFKVPVAGRTQVEVIANRVNVPPNGTPKAYILVFDGNGGRAEHAVFWGEDIARRHPVEVWSMNYPGYGRSPGKPTLDGIPPSALAVYDALKAKAGDAPVVIWGASLGSTAALHIAANRPVAGLVLTNPPPLKQLILGRYGWWNLWLAAIPVSLGVPAELDSLANAAKAKCPAVFATAENDRIVPSSYQRRVADAYAGPKQIVHLSGAGHNTPASEANPKEWYAAIDWLWDQLLQVPK